MKSPLEAYNSVSVDTIENLLKFMEETWMHGFPIVRKEDGRSKRQLQIHAALLLLSTTGCISRSEMNNLETINAIKEQLDTGGRLAEDTAFFLEKVRSPARYTRESVEKRKKR